MQVTPKAQIGLGTMQLWETMLQEFADQIISKPDKKDLKDVSRQLLGLRDQMILERRIVTLD